MSLVRFNSKRIAISYVLWAAFFLGVCGLHRFYNGKIVTGIVWFFTFGLCGIGQVVDLFLIPGMVESHDLELQQQSGYGPSDAFRPLQPALDLLPSSLTPEQQMVLLVQAAEKHGGKLSVTQGVAASGLTFTQVEKLLLAMVRSGYAHIGNDPITGAVTYYFDEL